MPKEEKYELTDTGLAVPRHLSEVIPERLRGVAVVPDSGSRATILEVETPAVVQEGYRRFTRILRNTNDLIPAAREFEAERGGAIDCIAQAAQESLKPGRLEQMIKSIRLSTDGIFSRNNGRG